MKKQCANSHCGREFDVRPSHYSKRTYCSRSCMALAYSEKNAGAGNPNYQGVAEERTCSCGNAFVVTSRAAVGKYCCHACAVAYADHSHLPAQAAEAGRKGAAVKHEQRKRYYCAGCSVEIESRHNKYCDACLPPRIERGRKDANQDEIVGGLTAAGALVFDAHLVKGGFPDLIAIFNGHPYLIEVKNPATRGARLTLPQRRFHATWQGQVGIAHTIEEALAIIGAS